MRIFLKSIPILILLIVCSNSTFAQTDEEKKKQADEFFEDGLYVEATKLYSSLLSNSARDHELNFKYGACLLYSSHKKEEAIKFLAYSIKSPSIDKRAYYFLGRAFHLNYQFKEAETFYNKFKEQATNQQKKAFNVDVQLRACYHGRNLLSEVSSMIVMKKTEIAEGSFYDLYDMSNIGGNILVTDEFGTKYDKKMRHRSVIHFPVNSPNIFFSSYGLAGGSGLDIYQMKKLPGGEYSLPQKLEGGINTDLDEDFAYMDPEGQYLYFCSKGHNSMGGYDVFRSRYDPSTGLFQKPENMDFAISSPDDDMLYMVDSKGSVAFFASNRESQDGKVIVYKVRVERIPVQFAAIKGNFVNAIVSSKKEITIEVEDFSSGRTVGVFSSKSHDGDYFMIFPKGGKYKFYMTVKGSDVNHYAVVEIPKLRELKPLKQQITLLRDEGGEQYLKVENLFDEAFDDPITVMAEIYQELATLEPNAEKFDLDSLDAQKDVDKIFVQNGLDPFTTQSDMQFILTEEVNDLNDELRKDQKLSNVIYNLAENKSIEANEKMLKVNKLIDQAEEETIGDEKKKLYEETYDLNKEVEQLNEDSQNLIDLGKQVDLEIIGKKDNVFKAKEILDEVSKISKNDRTGLTNIVEKNANFFIENVKDRNEKRNTVDQIIQDGSDNTRKADEINAEIIGLDKIKGQLEKDKRILEDQLARTNKKKDRAIIEDRILDVDTEWNRVNNELSRRQKDYLAVIDMGGKNLSNVARQVVDRDDFDKMLTTNQKIYIANTVHKNNLSESVAQIEKMLEDRGAGSRVDLFVSNEKRENYSFQQWTDDIDKEINDLRDQLNAAVPDRRTPILKRIQEFENLKEKKIQEFEIVERGDEGADRAIIDPDDIIASIDKDYQNRINTLYQIDDELKRIQGVKDLNEDIISATNEHIQALDAIVESDPNNENAILEKDKLIQFRDNIEKRIDEPIIDPVVIDPNNIAAKVEEDQLVKDYSNRQSEIRDIDDEYDQRKSQYQLDKLLRDKTRNQILQLDIILKDDLSNKDAKKRQDNLKKLDDMVSSRIVKNQNWLANNPRVDADIELAEVTAINSNYQEKINQIGTITDSTKRLEAIKELNIETIADINNRVNQIDNGLIYNPNDTKLTKERVELINLKNIIESNPVIALKEPLDDIAVNINPTTNDIMPGYDTQMDAIKTSGMDRARIEQGKIDLNRKFIGALDEGINRMNNLKNERPDLVAKFDKGIAGLNNFKDQKQREIDASQEIINSIDTNKGVLEIKTNPTTDDVMSDYSNRLNIINTDARDKVKAEKDRIDLNKELINNIDNEIGRLNNMSVTNPDYVNKIDRRIEALRNMKRATEKDIESSYELILRPEFSNRQNATIETLMPNYETDMAALRSNNILPERDRLEQENELNTSLVSVIDNKIFELQGEMRQNPTLRDLIDEEIEKLEELSESKQNEMRRNEELISQIDADIVNNRNESVSNLIVEDYNTESGRDVIKNHRNDMHELYRIRADLDDLNKRKDYSNGDKGGDRIQKQIDKKTYRQAKIENGIIEDLETANRDEFKNAKDKVIVDGLVASAMDPDDPEIIRANADLDRANKRMQGAQNLRDQAFDKRDAEKKNDLLNQALNQENDARKLVKNAGIIFKAARVIENYRNNKEVVITRVEKSANDRLSTQFTNRADELDVVSNVYSERSNTLRDSARTVNKKAGKAIAEEADVFDKKAAELREEARNLKDQANGIRRQEDEILALQLKGRATNPDKETIDDLSTNKDYGDFYKANLSAQENMDKANQLGKEIDAIKLGQERKIRDAMVSYSEENDLNNQLNDDSEIQRDQEKIGSLRTLQKKYKDQALQDQVNANDILDRVGQGVKDDFVFMAKGRVEPRDAPVFQPRDSLSADFNAPTNLNTDIFRRTKDAIYDESKVIPVDQKTNGLVYKVQVGAFRQSLPQDHFKEFAPISGQRLSNGVTRYMVGYFTKERTANLAREEIRGIGYSDAFVAAYCNGERITIQEAREIEAGRIKCIGTVQDESLVTNESNKTITENNINNGSNTKNDEANDQNKENALIVPNNEVEQDLASYYTNYPNAAKANQVEIVKGLFFAVQIGVYSKPVKPSILFYIRPLNSQRTDSGKIRYSTGMFTSVADASKRKTEVIGKGITDAFVTAYFNGERISIVEANRILTEQGAAAFFNSAKNARANFGNDGALPVDNNDPDLASNPDNTNNPTNPSTGSTVGNPENPRNIEKSNSDIFNILREDNGPPYRINLGFFQQVVPVDFTDLLLNNQNEGILSVSNLKDDILYFVGEYETQTEANERMDEMKAKGFNDAYIVSINRDEPVEDIVEYYAEGIYYKVRLGRFPGEIPGPFATVLLQTDNLIEVDEDVEGNIYLLSTKIDSISYLEDRLTELSELGFEDMLIVSYYQYDAIPMLQAQKIANGEPIGTLQKYEHHEGVNADPFLYHREAIYFHVEVGRFHKEVPNEFTNLLFENEDENILREETFDEELVFFTENMYDYEKVKQVREGLIAKGFANAKIVAFHKYSTISLEKALKILGVSGN